MHNLLIIAQGVTFSCHYSFDILKAFVELKNASKFVFG